MIRGKLLQVQSRGLGESAQCGGKRAVERRDTRDLWKPERSFRKFGNGSMKGKQLRVFHRNDRSGLALFPGLVRGAAAVVVVAHGLIRSEEHTSELQSL